MKAQRKNAKQIDVDPDTDKQFTQQQEARLAREAKTYPLSVEVIRARKQSQGEQTTEDDVAKMAEACAQVEHIFETKNIMRSHLNRMWPQDTERQGRAKWEDYEQLSLFHADLKLAGCRSYSVTLNDGTTAHRCLFEMNAAQRKEARKSLLEQRNAFTGSIAGMDRFERALKKLNVPDGIAPSDHLARKMAAIDDAA